MTARRASDRGCGRGLGHYPRPRCSEAREEGQALQPHAGRHDLIALRLRPEVGCEAPARAAVLRAQRADAALLPVALVRLPQQPPGQGLAVEVGRPRRRVVRTVTMRSALSSPSTTQSVRAAMPVWPSIGSSKGPSHDLQRSVDQ